jgi:SPFH domain / Band 7 family
MEVTAMPFVRANPNEYLLVGRGGGLENRGSAVQSFLWPGTVYVVVPSGRQEAAFEFTQETRDGIPLRFKGVVIYRITDPIAAAERFDFADAAGTRRISELLTHVVLGELRHAVSHMTMAECIEERKTTLSEVVRTALEVTTRDPDQAGGWGITVEIAQLAQVFIVDGELRSQLEAGVRNEIRLQSEQSDIQTSEQARLTSMASGERVAARKLEDDLESLRRDEALFAARMESDGAKANAEAPVRLLKIAREVEVLREELAMRELKTRVRASKVEHDLLKPRAEQELRREILPIEQAPEIIDAAAGVFRGANLSIYGEGAQLLGQVAPLLEVLAGAVRQATPAGAADPGSVAPDERPG